jgi:hypothetical protein
MILYLLCQFSDEVDGVPEVVVACSTMESVSQINR